MVTPELLAGRYRLSHVLGRGGMGAVWQAHDTLLGREVAVKEIHRLPGGDDKSVQVAVRRALREAQAAARLRHSGIVMVHDVVIEDARLWIVMELVHGPSLAQVIDTDGVLSAQRAAVIGVQVLEALGAAHRLGIWHRDVKPGNILLDGERAVLTDFGIATFEGAAGLTATGQLIGSPEYLAPERITGEDAGAAADLWAVGVTLCVLVAGESPFRRADAQATVAAVLTGLTEPVAGVGPLWPVIRGLLESDPQKRLTAARAVRLLSAVASGSAQASSVGEAHAGPSRRRVWLLAIPIVVILAGALAWSGPTKSASSSHRGTQADRRTTPPSPVTSVAQLAATATGGTVSPTLATPPSSTPARLPSPTPPAGYKFLNIGGGFGLAVPQTWETGQDSSATYNYSNEIHAQIEGQPVTRTRPPSSALSDLTLTEMDTRGSESQYHLLSLASAAPQPPVSSLAVWEYTTTPNWWTDTPLYMRYRVYELIVPNQGIYVITASVMARTEADRARVWADMQPILVTALGSFQPGL